MSRKSRRAARRIERRAQNKAQSSNLTRVGQIVASSRPKFGNIVKIRVREEYFFAAHLVIFVGTRTWGTVKEQRRAALEELEALFRHGCFPGLQFWYWKDTDRLMVEGFDKFTGHKISWKEYKNLGRDMMCAEAHAHEVDDSFLVLPRFDGGGKVVLVDESRQREMERLAASSDLPLYDFEAEGGFVDEDDFGDMDSIQISGLLPDHL